MKELSATSIWLGRAGVLPFCAGPALIAVDGAQGKLYVQALCLYALAIVCFLAGSWWGIALVRRSRGMLIGSNAIVIAAVGGTLLLSPAVALLWLAALLVATWRIERRHPLFAPQPQYYVALRTQLTVLAAVSLCVAAVMV